MTAPTTTWHFLCGSAGTLRSCAQCARNPVNQPEAALSPHQAWSQPAISSDGRCGDWMARRSAA